jgi:hypothetical protein
MMLHPPKAQASWSLDKPGNGIFSAQAIDSGSLQRSQAGPWTFPVLSSFLQTKWCFLNVGVREKHHAVVSFNMKFTGLAELPNTILRYFKNPTNG